MHVRSLYGCAHMYAKWSYVHILVCTYMFSLGMCICFRMCMKCMCSSTRVNVYIYINVYTCVYLCDNLFINVCVSYNMTHIYTYAIMDRYMQYTHVYMSISQMIRCVYIQIDLLSCEIMIYTCIHVYIRASPYLYFNVFVCMHVYMYYICICI